jgi:hypothetical protein
VKLFGAGGLFVVGAAATYAGFVLRGSERTWVLAVPALGAFFLSVGRAPLPLFAVLFAGVTASVGVASVFRRSSYASFAVLAASDLLLAGALTIFQLQTTRWDLPGIAGWGDARYLVAGAAILRLVAPFFERGDESLSLTGAGWWQGLLLAWWAGPPAAFGLCAGAALLLSFYLLRRSGSGFGFGFAGAIAAAAAGLGLPASVVFAGGAAGAAYVFGERFVSVWTMAAIPLSVLAQFTLDRLPAASALAAAAIPALIGLAVLVLPRPGSFGGRGTAALAIAAALVLGMQRGFAIWILYALIVVGGLTVVSTRASEVAAEAVPPVIVSSPQQRQRLAFLTAWAAAGVTVLLMIRMAALGFSTGFL